ncbi:glycoside hydrolase family 16 protein [Irpex rosettiformis]|uniref:Glycoside hydrolase family 16 protein n=1 Tax=Irpex rosettiformis TaxID=378272 RepID=A0ACB8UK82_9APHY|nr:glycoside hydrolase family 16 protein [Irpex rosettiformis]
MSLRPRQQQYNTINSSSQVNLLPPRHNPSLNGSPRPIEATFSQTPSTVSSYNDLSTDERYHSTTGKAQIIPQSISDKFSLSPNPNEWGANLSVNHREQDDFIHNPDPRRDHKNDQGGTIFTSRGLVNLGCLAVLITGILALFAGYPIISHFTKHRQATFGAFNLGGTNKTGQVPEILGNRGLIDYDTPSNAYSKPDYVNGKKWQLVFSDEFNVDGRSFYPGDDPYWEAADLHYWQTNNLEWYDPAAVTTKNGSLQITLSRKDTHGLDFQGGMVTTWNKFCFTGGLLETSVILPGINNIVGLWPAVWTMGNLGRAGYGASLEGMWPYTYDACDVGTVHNQTNNNLPVAAVEDGDPYNDNHLSFLPGQKLSRCTCPGESHPGPVHENGDYVGRAAPEIDVFEAQITGGTGQVSQSAQWAPFNAFYEWFNTTDNLIIADPDVTIFNVYVGGVFQQATSSVTDTNPKAYELSGQQFAVYGFQYAPGFDSAYIAWIANDKVAWTLKQPGMAADKRVEINDRPIPQEPMYIIANLGMSTNFGKVDLDHLTFPTTMSIDYIRVYQDPGALNIGCDPIDFPTADYINTYIEAYTNPNLTTWRDDFKQPFPKNSFLKEC